MSTPVSYEIFFGFAFFAVIFVALERWRPLRRQSAFRAGWLTDISYFAAGCVVGHLSDAASLGGMLLFRHVAGFDGEGWAAAHPAWLQFFEIILVADFCAYWYHRFIHRCAPLWRLHQIHHSSPRMDWLANARIHPIDKLLGDCAQFIPILCLGFGAAPLFAYTIFLGLQGFLNHANVRIDFGRLRGIVAGPQFHHWHHCDDPRIHGKNFAPHLVIFDRLFGTFYLPENGAMPESYGLAKPIPERFWAQMIYPLLVPSSQAARI